MNIAHVLRERQDLVTNISQSSEEKISRFTKLKYLRWLVISIS